MPFKVLHQTMKQKVITLSLLASMALTASATIHMTGKINNYSGGNVLLIQMSDTAQQSDTMAIAKDGSFVKDIQLWNQASPTSAWKTRKHSAKCFSKTESSLT